MFFDFGWGTFKQSLRSVQRLPLTSTEATYPHVRLHQLREEDSLSYFLSMMASIPATIAVILINSEDSYALTSKFHSEEQTPPVPMLVVTKETGGKLMQIVDDNLRAVEVKISLPHSLSTPRSRSSLSGVCACVCVRACMHVYMCVHACVVSVCGHTQASTILYTYLRNK